jgi:hypothetical protein
MITALRPPPIHSPPAREFIMRLIASVRPRCVSGLFIRALVVLLAALSLQTSALAQGTSGTLPDPINARDLTGYAERLQLSPQQRQAIDSFHEQYKREFRALREGEIADFLKSMRDLNGAGTMPKRDVVEKFLKKMESLSRKIEQVDDSLLDQMQTVLTPEQLALMPRVRQARQRDRYMSQQMMAFGGQGTNVDLSQMLYEMDLTAADRTAVDPTMTGYEAKLTQLMGKLYESASKMMMEMFDAMEKMGFTEQSMEDPETAQKMGEAMQNLWADLTRRSLELANDINQLNRKSSKAIASLLPPATGRTFTHKYWAKAYPEAGMSLEMGDRAFNAALKLKELNEEHRQAIRALQESLDQRVDQKAEQFVEYLDEFRKNRNPFDAGMGNWQEHQQKVVDFQQMINTETTASIKSLTDILGPGLVAKIPPGLLSGAPEVTEARLGDDVQVDVAVDATGDGAVVATAVSAAPGFDEDRVQGPDMFLPGAISEREISEYSGRLKLTDDQKSVLDGLFEQYAERFGTVTQEEVHRLTLAQQALWKYDEASGTSTGPTETQIDETYRLRQAALEAVNKVDEQFFVDVETAVLSETQKPLMPSVRMARQRMVYNRGADAYSAMGSSSEAGIDVARLIRQARLTDEQFDAIATELNQYESQAAAAFKTKYLAAIDLQKAQEKWNSQMMKAQADGGNAMTFAANYKNIMGEPAKALRQASEDISKLNHDTCERLIAALPAEQANSLRTQYDRKAFPAIYIDNIACLNQIDAALRLGDLTIDQRAKVNDLAAEYRPAYAHFSEEMARLSSGSVGLGFGMSFEAEDWQKWQERQDAMSKIAFDRNELSLKSLRQLRGILTESQVERLGGLAEPKVKEERVWY